jgi:uncharacterized protein YxjI
VPPPPDAASVSAMQAMVPTQGSALTLPSFLTSNALGLVQRKELVELLGFETRNKYSVHTPDGAEVAFCAEQGKGLLGTLARQVLGHWRTFQIHVFDASRQPLLVAEHPFRFFFARLDVRDARGHVVGAIQRRWAFFTKAFDVVDAHDRTLFTVRSPFWRIWRFRFMRGGRELAAVDKKWGGFLTEIFTDADRFGVTFDPSLSAAERALVLMAGLYVDLVYFENNQSERSVFDLLGQ